MITQGFRTYDIEANDFPITITASTDAAKLPDLASVAFLFQDVASGAVIPGKEVFHNGPNKTATLTLNAPSTPCNVVFAVQVRFPAANPADKPLKLLFLSSDNQRARDEILPEDKPIVFANYVMHFR